MEKEKREICHITRRPVGAALLNMRSRLMSGHMVDTHMMVNTRECALAEQVMANSPCNTEYLNYHSREGLLSQLVQEEMEGGSCAKGYGCTGNFDGKVTYGGEVHFVMSLYPAHNLVRILSEHHGAMLVSPMRMSEKMPEYNNGYGLRAIRSEVRKFVRPILENLCGSSANVIIPCWQEDPSDILTWIDIAKGCGARVILHYAQMNPCVAFGLCVKHFCTMGNYMTMVYPLENISPDGTDMLRGRFQQIASMRNIVSSSFVWCVIPAADGVELSLISHMGEKFSGGYYDVDAPDDVIRAGFPLPEPESAELARALDDLIRFSYHKEVSNWEMADANICAMRSEQFSRGAVDLMREAHALCESALSEIASGKRDASEKEMFELVREDAGSFLKELEENYAKMKKQMDGK